MRLLFTAFLAATLAASSSAAGERSATSGDHRATVVAALERLMQTGEPLDTEHGEGAWLQTAVDIAFVARDQEIMQLAQRAASPLLTHVASPVSSIRERPAFEVRHRNVLRLAAPVTAEAELFASLDGGELVPVGRAPRAGTSMSLPLPPGALAPGIHHIRVQARIVYKGKGDVPPPETRNLPELTYALYDPERHAADDARMFIHAPIGVRARQFDPSLPDEPFGSWLLGLLAKHSAKPTIHWAARYCDDRVRESGALPKTRRLCSVGYFEVNGVIGQIWIRTGRIELTDTNVNWLPEAPAFEGFKLLHGSQTEYDTLAELPALLAADPSQLPTGDISVAPEDISIAPVQTTAGPQLEISAIVRNNGPADLRGVQVFVLSTVNGENGPRAAAVVDVPRRGHAVVRQVLPFSGPYGTVLVHALQGSEHGPFESFSPDPTPDDAIAFRIVNAKNAPAGYAARIARDCGGVCRGY
jgi:hypothetical protein